MTDHLETPKNTQVELRVRYCECDPQGVAHHGVYPVWLEIARTELLRQFGVAYSVLEQRGIFFVVTELAVKYRQPARYDDRLVIHVSETKQTRVRIDHGYEVRRDGIILASATSTIACVNAQGRPMAIPDGALGCSPPKAQDQPDNANRKSSVT